MNKIKQYLIAACLVVASLLSYGQKTLREYTIQGVPQSSDLHLVKSFMKDVKGKEKGYNEIIQLYLCSFDQNKYQEKVDLTVNQLTELRNVLKDAEVRVQPYAVVPASEQRVLAESTDDIYRVLANEEHICFVLVKNHRIMSFSTMKKGTKGAETFLVFCD